jgi:hypothetical protein
MIRFLKRNFTLDYASRRLTLAELERWLDDATRQAAGVSDPAERSKLIDQIQLEAEHKRFLISLREAATTEALSRVIGGGLGSWRRTVNAVTFLAHYARVRIDLETFVSLLRVGGPYAAAELLRSALIVRAVDASSGDIARALAGLLTEGVITRADIDRARGGAVGAGGLASSTRARQTH